MSLGATISVMAINDYCLAHDVDIFQGFGVPNGVDRDALINKMLLDTAEMECLYPEPLTLQSVITAWSRCNIQQWSRLWETCTYDYDPFENYDITEEYTRTPDLSTVSRNSGTDTQDNLTQAFNSNSLQQNSQQRVTLSSQNQISESGTDKFTRHTYGDASVRSVSQVVLEMREERLWSFYEYVVDSFITTCCNRCYSI